jgi:hypothetical protein
MKARAFKKPFLQHYDVTAAITLKPVSAFSFGHHLEVVACNAIRAADFLHRPKGRRKTHATVFNTISKPGQSGKDKGLAERVVFENA